MANNMPGDIEGLGFVNKQRATLAGSSGQTGIGTAGDYASVATLRTALSTANAAYYTSALLDRLTVNDMVYALRQINGGNTSAGSI